MTTADQQHQQQLHVPGCGLRATVLEGPRAASGEDLDTWAKRVAHTRCTCRSSLGGLVAVVLKPFSGQRLTPELVVEMQATVDRYVARTKERYGDNGWDVSLTMKPGTANEVDVHLIPPPGLEVTAGAPVTKLVPPANAPASAEPLPIEPDPVDADELS